LAIAILFMLMRAPVAAGGFGLAVFVVMSSGAWWRLHRGFDDG